MVADAFARLPLHDRGHGHPHAHDHDHADGHAHDRAHDGHARDHAQAHDHNDAHEHGHGAPARPRAPSLLLIENVGNLVCPALWDLGERAKVAILSVTEGDDKPAKYPDMFAASTLMLLNKVDLLPHVDFDVERCIAHARRIHPAIEVLQVSARRGDGMDAWLDWLLAQLAPAPGRDAVAVPEGGALERRVAELEARLRAAGLEP
jgi:hydrogenase nickel incorporation protein HypB